MAYKLLRPPACLTFNSLLNPTHLCPHFPSRPPSFSSFLPLHFPSSLSFTSPQGESAAILATRSSQVSEETTLLRPKVTATNVVDILEQRGLLESLTNEAGIRSVCSGIDGPVKVYCGFDPTAESLHLGNLLGLIVLSWFQRCGHIPVAVLGGATARVGDPSGKSAERPVLGETMIKKNLKGVEANIVQEISSKHVKQHHFHSKSGRWGKKRQPVKVGKEKAASEGGGKLPAGWSWRSGSLKLIRPLPQSVYVPSPL